MTSLKSENFTVRDTAHVDGGAYRWLELADGSWRAENWTAGGWVPGGASISEFFDNPPVGAAFARKLGIPLSDLGAGALARHMAEKAYRNKFAIPR